MDKPLARSPDAASWSPLKTGDTVYLIAPSTPTNKGTLEYMDRIFSGMGLKTTSAPGMTDRHFNWGNTAEHRAKQIISALNTPGVKAIYAMEGGEGASEVVAELKKHEKELLAAKNRGIPLIGGSDITFLHHYLGEKGIVTPVQGPPAAYLTDNRHYMIEQDGRLKEEDISGLSREESEKRVKTWERNGTLVSRPRSASDAAAARHNAALLKDFLMGDGAAEPGIPLIPLNDAAKKAGTLEGVIVGGADQITLASAYITHGPDHALHKDKKPILFLEGKTLQEMQFTFRELKDSGNLERYGGVVLGSYYGNTTDPKPAFPAQQAAEILKMTGAETLPVYYGVPFGHAARGGEMRPIPLYTPAAITAKEGRITLSVHRRSTRTALETREALDAPHAKPSPAVLLDEPVAINLHDHLVANVNRLHAMDMKDKDVVLQFPFGKDASASSMINPAHFILMPLTEKLRDAKSLTLVSVHGFPPEFDRWLDEFARHHLPGKTVKATRQETAHEIPVTDYEIPEDRLGDLRPVQSYIDRLEGISRGVGLNR